MKLLTPEVVLEKLSKEFSAKAPAEHAKFLAALEQIAQRLSSQEIKNILVMLDDSPKMH